MVRASPFVGRALEMEQIHAALRDSRVASVLGPEGIGKTRVVQEFARVFRGDYPGGVYWFTQAAAWDAQLAELAETANLIGSHSRHVTKREVARFYLESTERSLVVFDDVADPQTLPSLRNADSIWILDGLREGGVTVPPLGPSEMRLLTSPAERGLCGDVDRLGGNPLAARLANACAKDSSWAWSESTARIDDLVSTLYTSLAEPLKHVLGMIAWGGDVPMGGELIAAVAGASIDDAAWGALLESGLVDLDGDRVTMHRLIRRAVRPLTGSAPLEAVVEPAMAWYSERRDSGSFVPFDRESRHLASWCSHALRVGVPGASRLLWLTSYPPFHHGDYSAARAILAAVPVAGDPWLEQRVCADLGSIHAFMGEFDVAVHFDQRALELGNRTADTSGLDLAALLHNLAHSLSGKGEHDAAITHYLRAIAVLELEATTRDERSKNSKQPLLLATCLNDLATSYHEANRFEEAIRHHAMAIAAIEQSGVAKTAAHADLVLKRAETHQRQGRTAEALEFAQAAAKLLEHGPGRHPDTARAWLCVSELSLQLGYSASAVQTAAQAYEICRGLLGPTHCETGVAMLRLARAYQVRSETNIAASYFRAAMEILEKELGADHADTLSALAGAAMCLIADRRHEEARRLVDVGLLRADGVCTTHAVLSDLRRECLARTPQPTAFPKSPRGPDATSPPTA
jgi:tetratricopeptide (TPR) repeat protein